jgi:hypothetical protein
MSTAKDKIAKLLALSTSPNEKEAQEALLKARELMAKHKLSLEECQGQAQTHTVKRTVGVECTKMTDTWVVPLANTIAKRYCCVTFRSVAPKAKKGVMGFIGLEDDFEVCRRVFLYAYDYVKMRCKKIRSIERHRSSAKDIREMCNTFGWAFSRGLNEAFEAQEEQHQEWGLVMMLPQQVQDAVAKLEKKSHYDAPKGAGWRSDYAKVGYAEGKKFAPERQLEPANGQKKASA